MKLSIEQRRNARAEEMGYPRGNPPTRPTAPSGAIPTCENLRMTPPGIKPGSYWWEADGLTTTAPRRREGSSPLFDDRPITNAVKYTVVSGVVWTNRTMASSNTDTNRTGVLAVVDIGDLVTREILVRVDVTKVSILIGWKIISFASRLSRYYDSSGIPLKLELWHGNDDASLRREGGGGERSVKLNPASFDSRRHARIFTRALVQPTHDIRRTRYRNTTPANTCERASDEALGVHVSVARIAPWLLDLGRAGELIFKVWIKIINLLQVTKVDHRQCTSVVGNGDTINIRIHSPLFDTEQFASSTRDASQLSARRHDRGVNQALLSDDANPLFKPDASILIIRGVNMSRRSMNAAVNHVLVVVNVRARVMKLQCAKLRNPEWLGHMRARHQQPMEVYQQPSCTYGIEVYCPLRLIREKSLALQRVPQHLTSSPREIKAFKNTTRNGGLKSILGKAWRSFIRAGHSLKLQIARKSHYLVNPYFIDIVKYLAVHMDRKPIWKAHIDAKCISAHARLSPIYPILNRRSAVTRNTAVLLCTTLMLPVITYATPTWAHTAKTHNKRLLIVQNKCLLIAADAPRYCHITDMNNEIKIVKLDEHFQHENMYSRRL
ncbi:hypothetical protein PR048_003696 [Dryococelus australis]|uniref:Uncharacterized protein n=1 Tax=Dryococelus australis TaxID=614101 RepID=A0ABQ9INQ4_9NEOP|nr:hypothetical protein PR048_003696 [Dryococelus australis]